MAGMYFSVGADFERLKKLKKDIEELEEQLVNMDRAVNPKVFDELNDEFSKTSKEVQALEKSLGPILVQMAEFDKVADQARAALESAFQNGSVTDQVEAQREMVQALEKQYESLKISLDDLSLVSDTDEGLAYYEQARQKINEVNEEILEQKDRLGFLETSLKSTSKAVSDTNKEYGFVKPTLDDVNEVFDKTIKASDKLQKELGEGKGIEENIKAWQRHLAVMAEARGKLGALVASFTAGSEEMTEASDKHVDVIHAIIRGNKELQKLTERQGGKVNESYMTQIRKIKEEMTSLSLAGKQESVRYRELEVELEKVGTAYRKVQQEQKLLTTAGNAQLAGLIQGITGLSGAFSAGMGVVGLFTKDNEKLAAIQTKLQAVMAITIGLQQVSNTLHTTSAFRINTVSKVTRLWGNAQQWLTLKLGGSTVAAQIFMATITLGLSVAITGIIYLISKYSSEASKASEMTKKFNDATASSASNSRAEFEKLRQEWVRAGNDLKAKEKLVLKNVDAYNKFGVEINNVKDADNLFIDNADAFVESINKRAMATAAMDLASEKYKEAMQKMLDADERADNPTFWDKFRGYMSWSGLQQSGIDADWDDMTNQWAKKSSSEMKTEAEKAGKDAIKYTAMSLGYDDESKKKIKDAGGKATEELKEGTKAFYQAIRDAKQKELDKMTQQELGSKYGLLVKQQRDAAAKMLKLWDAPKTGEENKLKKDAQKKADLQLKIANDQEKADLNAYNATLENKQKRLDLEDASFKKEQKQLDLNSDKAVLAAQRRVQELIEAQQGKERDKWKQDGEKGIFTPTTKTSTDLFLVNPDAEKEYNEALKIAKATYDKGTNDLLKSLLDKYQDYNRQRVELEKQYSADEAALISRRTEENAQEIDASLVELAKKRKESLSSVNTKEFQEGIDWESVFGNLDKVSTQALVDVRDKLKDYLSSAADSMSKEDLKLLSDAFENLNEKIANRRPINELRDGYREYKKACEEVAKAQKKVNDLISSGKGETKEVKDATKELSDAQKKRRESLVKMSASVNDMGQKGGELVNSGQELVGMLTNLGVEVPESIGKALDGLGQVMGGLEKIDFTKPFSIISGGVSVLSGIGNTIAGIFGGGNSEISQERFDQYEALISTMSDLISKQVEMLNAMAGQQAVAQTEKAIALINKQADAARNMGDEFLNSGAKWNKRSHGVRLRRELEGYAEDFNRIGISFDSLGGRMTGLFDLSTDQLTLLKEEIPEAWAKLDDNTRSYLQTIIDSGNELDELKEKLNETLTAVSFDSVKSTLNSFLLDTDATMEDVANNFEDYMRNAISNIITNSLLTDELESWYRNFANAMKDDKLTEGEKEVLRKEYEEIYNNAIKMRDELFDIANIDLEKKDSKQQSSKGYSVSMSQDTGDKLVGIATGGHMTRIEILGNVSQILQETLMISNSVKGIETNQEEIKNVAIDLMFNVRDINKNTKELYQVNERIGEMSKKLDRL